MHALLDRYTTAIHRERGGVCLAASVLHKRALSSAWSLAQSVERRLEALSREHEVSGEQLALPLADPDGELTSADEAPNWPADLGLVDVARERRILGELHAAARFASRHETKLHALVRLLRRSGEPAIVFTEYRDTLLHVHDALGWPAAILHGGLRRDERAAALDDFSRGRRTLLLATDAGAEGLNLHHTCRLVINLELPWNPMRLEQRIGRVDRIGQTRAVHAFHLVAADTAEMPILTRLQSRIARARADIGAPDPIGRDEEQTVARLVMLGAQDEPPTPATNDYTTSARIVMPDLQADAIAEAQRVATARVLSDASRRSATLPSPQAARQVAHETVIDALGPWTARSRSSRVRARLRGRVLVLWRAAIEDASGRPIETTLVPMHVDLTRDPPRERRPWIGGFLHELDREARNVLDEALAGWHDSAKRTWSAFMSTRLARERAIDARFAACREAAFQPGLFDRSAERAHAADAAVRASADVERAGRLHALERLATITRTPPQLVLVLMP
jgi:hypothetical protein